VGTPASVEHEDEGVAIPTQVPTPCLNVHAFLETLAMEIRRAKLQLHVLNGGGPWDALLNGTHWKYSKYSELVRKSNDLKRFIVW
jgi:hypothetical protein